jgi:antitoxin VapB
MPLNIKNDEADRLARALAKQTGDSITDAVIHALREQLARQRHHSRTPLKKQLHAIGKRCASLPDLDTRTADEILGYNQIGIPE